MKLNSITCCHGHKRFFTGTWKIGANDVEIVNKSFNKNKEIPARKLRRKGFGALGHKKQENN